MIGRYGLLAKSGTLSSEALELSPAQKNFLQKCLAWKKFLFDDQGHVKNHSLEVVLDTGRQGSGLYTTLYFEGLKNSQGAPLSLRFSGQHYKRSQTEWNLRSASEIRIEAKNEETGADAGMNISGGSLALPAYILTNGTMEDDIGLSEWAMDIKLSDSMKIGSEGLNNADNFEATFISIPVRFIWDETIPDGIIWPG